MKGRDGVATAGMDHRSTINGSLKRERLKLSVRAAAAFVWRFDPVHEKLYTGAKGVTKIRIEGKSEGYTRKIERDTLLLVSRETEATTVAGYALGGKTPWSVSCELPDEQFRDLLALVLADRLYTVEMVFDRVRWYKGILLSVDFATRPLPSEAE